MVAGIRRRNTIATSSTVFRPSIPIGFERFGYPESVSFPGERRIPVNTTTVATRAVHSTSFHRGDSSFPSGKRSSSVVPIRMMGGTQVGPEMAMASAPPEECPLLIRKSPRDPGPITHAMPMAMRIQPMRFLGCLLRISTATIGNAVVTRRKPKSPPEPTVCLMRSLASASRTSPATKSTR